MQDAFFQEKNAVGDWVSIGYSAPGTGSSHSYASNTFWYHDDNGKSEWYASPKQKLNDCAAGTSAGKQWGLAATDNSTNSAAATSFQIANASAGGSNCLTLTPSWDALTRSSN